MSLEARFEIEITPSEAVLPTTGRFDFSKAWSGAAQGISKGMMISAGDPANGTAGYVAMEVFEGAIDGRSGTLAFYQFGTMVAGVQELRYEIVPGSGTGDLAGLGGTLALVVDDEGDHHVTFALF